MKRFLQLLFLVFTIGLNAQDPTPVSGINFKKNSKWLSQVNGKTVIEVSWENPTGGNQIEREWVRSAIRNSWEKVANIEFTGWGQATPTSKGIRILIDPTGWPHVKALGNNLDGRTDGMVLNFDFQGRYKCNTQTRENCIKFIAVHEFGHALGLAHEHNRRDCLCNEDPQGGDGDFYVTPCDLESVMNYCNPKWSNHGQLSPLDVVGIQVIYGKPSAFQSVATLNEVRFIPTSPLIVDRCKTFKDIISSSKAFAIKSYTQEDKAVPQKAIDRVPATNTIRFFALDDSTKAVGLKMLLVSQGFKDNSIIVQNMVPIMNGTIENYIEIWVKEDKVGAVALDIDEIRLVPTSANFGNQIKLVKDAVNATPSFAVKTYTQETNPVPQRAIVNLPNTTTIRFFHPDDETKAVELKRMLAASGYDTGSVTLENMVPRMSKVYPKYLEVWFK